MARLPWNLSAGRGKYNTAPQTGDGSIDIISAVSQDRNISVHQKESWIFPGGFYGRIKSK